MNRPPEAYRLDKRQVGRAFGRAASTYERTAVLQAQVQESALRRLELIRCAPALVLDLGCGTGEGARALARRYRGAHVVGADLAAGMLRRARRRFAWRGPRFIAADAEALPFPGASCDLVYSNLMLQWLGGVETAFAECARVLKPGGLLLLTTFGPDTLIELRRAFAEVDLNTHVSAFLDLHDLGDALVRGGFEAPVLDVERYTLTYATLEALARDLKAIGATNAAAGRSRGLLSPRRWARVRAAYEAFREGGVLPASYEVIHAHAWRSAARARPARDEAPLQFIPPRRRDAP